MSRLPVLSGREILKILYQLGYRKVRQRGSHIRLEGEDKRPVTVPDYKEVDRSLLKKILRDAEITADQFVEMIRG